MKEAIEIVENIMCHYLNLDGIPKNDLEIALRVLMNVRKAFLAAQEEDRAEFESHEFDANDPVY